MKAEAQQGWRGGVNLTALRMLEDRAYGWLSLLTSTAEVLKPGGWGGKLGLNFTTSGTRHGLSKMVYWRDTRRAVGPYGFKLLHTELRDTVGPTGIQFADSVAIGDYNDDTHHLDQSVCTYPEYLQGAGEGSKPYYIPFRALMVSNATNLLVAGKLMSQSFHANSNTRLHPSEWTSGVAAGGTAALMVRNGWNDTVDAYKHIDDVQTWLNSSVIGQPLQWSRLPPMPPPEVGSTCALSRCIGVDASSAKIAKKIYVNDTSLVCNKACKAMADYEWLANMSPGNGWVTNNSEPLKPGVRIYASKATWLKKSTAMAMVLPKEQRLRVESGAPCIVVGVAQFDGYLLCIHHVQQSGSNGEYTDVL